MPLASPNSSDVGAAGNNVLGQVKVTDGTDVADVIDQGTNSGLATVILDGSGDPITSFGGGTQYTEGATDATITGTALMWEDGADTLVVASAAKPLPVEASIDTTGLALETKQDTQITHLAAIEAAVEGTVAVSNAGLTELAAAINASSQMDVNIAASGATVPVSHSALTELAAAIDTEVQVDIVGALPAGTNAIGKLAANSGVDIGDVDVTSIAAGTNLVGDVGIQPRTTNGLDTFMASGSDGSSILVATAQVIKASAGKLYGYYAFNPEASTTFVHFYNTAAASVTVGTTNPLFTLAIPAGAAANLMSEIGITFSNAGWSCAATTTAGGNTAPSTGVSLVAWYK
jgi:hypothetical protein